MINSYLNTLLNGRSGETVATLWIYPVFIGHMCTKNVHLFHILLFRNCGCAICVRYLMKPLAPKMHKKCTQILLRFRTYGIHHNIKCGPKISLSNRIARGGGKSRKEGFFKLSCKGGRLMRIGSPLSD